MNTYSNFKAPHSSVRSSWRPEGMLRRGLLTDKKIEKYRKQGWYSPELKQARRELNERKRMKSERREGNFIVSDGKLIFSPR